MQINVYTGKAEKTIIKLAKIKDIAFGKDTFQQYVRVFLANQRKNNAKAKTRAEVRGGGKKPWSQKGTGRARAGSSRSPIWVGGGISHGPKKEAAWYLSFNKNTKKSILAKILQDYIEKGNAVVLNLDFKKPNTKEFKSLIANIYKEGYDKSLLVHDNELNVKLSARNISQVKLLNVTNLNSWEIAKSKKVLITENAFKKLEGRI